MRHSLCCCGDTQAACSTPHLSMTQHAVARHSTASLLLWCTLSILFVAVVHIQHEQPCIGCERTWPSHFPLGRVVGLGVFHTCTVGACWSESAPRAHSIAWRSLCRGCQVPGSPSDRPSGQSPCTARYRWPGAWHAAHQSLQRGHVWVGFGLLFWCANTLATIALALGTPRGRARSASSGPKGEDGPRTYC